MVSVSLDVVEVRARNVWALTEWRRCMGKVATRDGLMGGFLGVGAVLGMGSRPGSGGGLLFADRSFV